MKKKTKRQLSAWADSYAAAAATLKSTVGELKALKRWGSAAFRHGRIRLDTAKRDMDAFRAERKDKVPREKPSAAVSPMGDIGVSPAFQRLQEAERRFYSDLQNALDAGDAERIAGCRRNWVSAIDALRRYETSIADNKLRAGELVSRTRVAEALIVLGIGIKYAIAQTATEAAANCGAAAPETRTRLVNLCTTAVTNGLATAVTGFADKLDPWVIAAFTKGASGLFDVEGEVAQRAQTLADVVGVTLRPDMFSPRPGWPTDWSWHRGLWYARRAGMEFDEAWAKYGHLPRRAEVPELEPQYTAEELAKIERYTEQTRLERAALAEKKPGAPATPTA